MGQPHVHILVIVLVDARVRALDYLSGDGATATVNLGTGVGSSVRQIIDMTARVGGVGGALRGGATPTGDPVAVHVDNPKAHRVLGWRPRLGLDEIVASAWCSGAVLQRVGGGVARRAPV